MSPRNPPHDPPHGPSEPAAPGNRSRLAAHLHLTGAEPRDDLSPDALAAERRLLDAVGELPTLDFHAQDRQTSTPALTHSSRRSRHLAGGILFAAAAALTLMVWQQRSDEADGLRIKGELGAATVYYEHDGATGTVTPETKLEGGAKIRVEIAAHAAVVAFMTVVNDKATLLIDPLTRPLTLGAGERAAFPGAVELTGADEDETVLALICPRHVADAADLGRLLTQVFTTRHTAAALSACKLAATPLR